VWSTVSASLPVKRNARLYSPATQSAFTGFPPSLCPLRSLPSPSSGPVRRGRKPPFSVLQKEVLLFFKRRARPHKSPVQNRFTSENAAGALGRPPGGPGQ
jgi:hypothetical protein